MSGLVVALMLAAAGSTEVEGAITAGGQLEQKKSASLQAVVHGRLDLSREFGRFFVAGRASVLVSGGTLALNFRDLGSRLTVGYRPLGFVESVSLEVIPFSPSIRLASFDWANAWGASTVPISGLPENVFFPMLTAQVDTRAGAAWFGARFRAVRNDVDRVTEILPDLLFGIDVPLPNAFRLEARGAYLNHGFNRVFASQRIEQRLVGGGAAARLSWTFNEPVGPPVDLVTYATDPLRFERFFVSEPRRSNVAAWVGLEGGAGAQQLPDPDRFGKLKTDPMGWADLQVRLRLRDVRLFGTARVQSVTLLAFDRLGVVGGAATPLSSTATPSVTGIIAIDGLIRSLRLTPGAQLRLMHYGTLRTFQTGPLGNNPPPEGASTILLGPNFARATIPDGTPVAPVIAAKVSARWEVASFASVVGEFEVEQDFNPTLAIDNPQLVSTRVVPPLDITGQLFVQARF